MKAWWKVQAARIDALSLRERAFLFVSLLVCLVALADAVWLSPAQTRQKQLAARVKQQDVELQGLRAALQAAAASMASGNAKAIARDELQALRVRAQALDFDIGALTQGAAGSDGLQAVLLKFLRRHDGLTLVNTSTLGSEILQVKAAPNAATPAPAAAQPQAGGSAPVPVLVRRNLALTVAGPYLKLMAYVDTLERELPGVRWGELRLTSDPNATQLSLQVSVVGLR